MNDFRRIDRGRWHEYRWGSRRVPGVTDLLRDGIPKPALINWAARSAAEYAADNVDTIATLERDAAVDLIKSAHNRNRNRAAVRGTDVHALAFQLRTGAEVDVPDELAGFVDAYLQYLDDWTPELVAIERPVLNRRWFYAGTFDEVARLRGHSRAALIDIKTGASGVFPETCLQVAAYRAAEVFVDDEGNEQPMPETGEGYALWLADDGRYELLPVASGADMFAVFLHTAHVATFMKRAEDDRDVRELIGVPMAAPVAVA